MTSGANGHADSAHIDGMASDGPDDERQAAGGQAPDGGWGWVVLVATMLVLALTLAFPSCVGIFYNDLQRDFHASNSQISWVPAIMTAVLHAGGRPNQSMYPVHTISIHR